MPGMPAAPALGANGLDDREIAAPAAATDRERLLPKPFEDQEIVLHEDEASMALLLEELAEETAAVAVPLGPELLDLGNREHRRFHAGMPPDRPSSRTQPTGLPDSA